MDPALLHILHPEAYHRHFHQRKLRPDGRPVIPVVVNADPIARQTLEINEKAMRKFQMQISGGRKPNASPNATDENQDQDLVDHDDGTVRALCRIGKTACVCSIRPELLVDSRPAVIIKSTEDALADPENSSTLANQTFEKSLKNYQNECEYLLAGIQIAVQLSGMIQSAKEPSTGVSSTDTSISANTVTQHLQTLVEKCVPISRHRESADDRPVWILRIQCTVMNDDGAVMDCLLMALVGALMNVEIPKLVRNTQNTATMDSMDEGETQPSQWYRTADGESHSLSLTSVPLPLTSIAIWQPESNATVILPDPTREEHQLYCQHESWTVMDAISGQLLLQVSGLTANRNLMNPERLLAADQQVTAALLNVRRKQLTKHLA